MTSLIAPKSGIHSIYKHRLFGPRAHPTTDEGVGLKVEKIEPKHGEFSRLRIHGAVKDRVVNWYDTVYEPGDYDFVVIQEQPEDWSGWFND